MGKARTEFALGIVFSWFLVSCMNQGGLIGQEPSSDRSAASLTTQITSGQVFSSQQTLTLSASGSPVFDLARVSLSNISGKVLWTNDFDPGALGLATLGPAVWKTVEADPSFTPSIFLTYDFLKNGTKQSSLSIPLFLMDTVPSPSLTSLPSEAEPDSSFLCQLSPVPLSDAWVVWRVDGKVVDQGPWSAHTRLIGTTGSMAGVFEVSADGYPDPPAASSNGLPPAAFSVHTNVVVATKPALQSNELGPESSYASLYHFRGNLKDSISNQPLTYSADDAPVWDAPWGVLAARASAATSWSRPGSLTQGVDGPFSWEAVLEVPTDAQSSVLVKSDAGGVPILQIGLDQTRFPYFSVSYQGKVSVSKATSEWTDAPGTLVLSVFPSDSGWRVDWYVDGRRAGEDFLSGLPAQPSSLVADKTSWGGPAIWAESGVFVRDSLARANTDPDVFLRAMTSLYGSDLVFAQGFDGAFAPAGWIQQGSETVWPPLLTTGASLTSPSVTLKGAVWSIHSTTNDGNTLVAALDAQGRTLWSAAAASGEKFWDRRGQDPATVRFRWTNLGAKPTAVEEIAIFRRND